MRFASALLATSAMCGCTSSGANLDDGPLVAVAQATTTSGALDISVLAHSPQPTRGDHTIELVVTRPQDGSPVDGLALTIVPWMPAMGHGTSLVPSVTALTGGTYQVDNVDVFMPGLWEIRITIAEPSDHAAPSFQVQ